MIGLEPTFADHLDNLVAVFREVRRVLRSDGSLWLNYGDAYGRGEGRGTSGGPGKQQSNVGSITRPEPKHIPGGLKPKDLLMMPARVAMALQADGWWFALGNHLAQALAGPPGLPSARQALHGRPAAPA